MINNAQQNEDLINLLLKRKFFKLDLNNVDLHENSLEKLLCIFISAGCSAIDINVQNQDIKFLKNSINSVFNNVNNLKKHLVSKPLIISSFYKQSLESKNLDLKKVICQAIIDGSNIIELHLSEFITQEAIQVLDRIQGFPAEIILSISISRKLIYKILFLSSTGFMGEPRAMLFKATSPASAIRYSLVV